MKRNRAIIVLCTLFLASSYYCYGQDLHYSQFFNTPLNISPSLAGNFDGDHRIGGNLKQQWQSVPVDYKSFDVYYDFKTDTRFTTNHFNLGAIINYDDTGDLGLRHTGVDLVGAYALRLNDKIYLNPGIGIGLVQRRYDASSATSGNQWDGREFDPLIAAEFIGGESLSYFNLSGGVSIRYREGERSFVDVGGSAFNINSVDQSLNDGASYLANLERRYNVFVMGNWRIARKFDFVFNGVYQSQKPHKETLVNGQLKFYLDKYGAKAISFGAGIRLKDAWYPMIAFKINDIYASLSYDINFSDFTTATNGKGGPELAFRYIITKVPFYPKKRCPIY